MLIALSRLAAFTLLVSTPSLLPAQRLRVEPTPALVLSQDQLDAADVQVITNATRLPDGSLVVGNRGDHALLVFNAKGVFVRKLARQGKGPGEVTGLGALYRCGDRIYTQETGSDRMQEFTLALAYQREFRFAVPPFRLSCNARQQFVLMGWESGNSGSPGRTYRTPVDFLLLAADTAKGRLLARLPGSERFGNFPQPLGRQPRVAISGERVFVALADSLHVLTYDRSGNPLPGYRASWTPAAVTPADWESEKARDLAMFGESARRMLDEMYAEAPRPRHLPATRDLVVDALGNLWVQAYPRSGDTPVTWTVFDTRGSVAARLLLPSSLEVLEIGQDYLLALAHSAERDFPEVRVYRVTR